MGSTPIGISGSRAAAILGMSPWATPFSVWQDIMENRQPGFNAARKYDYEPFEGNASTRWGLAFEDAIVKLAEEKQCANIEAREIAFSYADLEYVTCHIDGAYPLQPDNNYYRVLHEGKTTTAFGMDKWGEPGTDRIPAEYQIQAQHQMLCTGADECIVSVLVFPKRPDEWEEMGYEIDGDEKNGYAIFKKAIYADDYVAMPHDWAATLAQMGFFHQYTVKANPDLHALMLDKYREWWDLWVIGETAPPPVTYDDIRAMITAPVGTIVVDDKTARWFKERGDIQAEIGGTSPAAKKSEQLKVQILDSARDLESTLDDDSTDKWVFMDSKGNKLGSYGRTKAGSMVFR